MYSIGELAEKAQLSKRTIRFYVALGIISPPFGRGRGSHYSDQHLQEILTVRKLKNRGLPLAEIQSQKDRYGVDLALADQTHKDLIPQLVTRISLDSGIVLEFSHVMTEITPAEMKEIAHLCRKVLKDGTNRE